MAPSLELDRLKRFSEIVAQALPLVDAPSLAIRSELLRAIAGTTTLRGARMLVSDLLEWTQDLTGPALAELDQSLAAFALPTLTLMRSREDKQFASILGRGTILTEDEYRLVNTRLGDTASALSDTDRLLGERLLALFRTWRRPS
jgi:hypothetical protein